MFDPKLLFDLLSALLLPCFILTLLGAMAGSKVDGLTMFSECLKAMAVTAVEVFGQICEALIESLPRLLKWFVDCLVLLTKACSKLAIILAAYFQKR